MKELSDEALSRWIAEKNGWRLIVCAARGGKEHWHAPHPNGGEYCHVVGKQPDMVHDPAMTVMLMEKLLDSRDYECIIGPDEIEMSWRPSAVLSPRQSFMVSLIKNKLGRAVAESVALANGWRPE